MNVLTHMLDLVIQEFFGNCKLNIEKAYDPVSWEVLMLTLKKWDSTTGGGDGFSTFSFVYLPCISQCLLTVKQKHSSVIRGGYDKETLCPPFYLFWKWRPSTSCLTKLLASWKVFLSLILTQTVH